MSPRRVVANLGFEEELRVRYGEGPPARTLTAAARRAAARAGSLLRVFTREGDRLWLPGPPGPGRAPNWEGGGEADAPAGLPEPVLERILERGPLEDLPPVRRLLAWGEGPRIAALRERWGTEEPTAAADGRRALKAPLHEAVWHVPAPPPEVVARVAHRGFGLELARERRDGLPGARLVADPAELERHLAASGPFRRAGGGRWVVKAPYSAAGRERLVGEGRAVLGLRDGSGVRRRLERLFERHGRLLLEPWVERTGDFGCAGLLIPRGTGEGVRLASVHRQQVDRAGRFRGIVGDPAEGDPGLAPEERDALEAAFHAAAEALRAAGYAGPFGIDAFRWRRPGGGEAFHPLCELNPRLTFGLVAQAVQERLESVGRACGPPD